MNVYITKLNGLPAEDTSQYIQRMTAEIAHQLGCREMGIYRYNGDNESSDSLNGRLDGIIAGIDWGNDAVICQFPTGNGFKYEWELVKRLKMYQSRVVVFIHDSVHLVKKANRAALEGTVRLYNQADVLIVPSLAMRQFLLENGLKKNMKFVIQEMWDCTADMDFFSSPQFRKEIHFVDSNGFEGMDKWNSTLPLKTYTSSVSTGQNVHNIGKLFAGELFSALSKGGFGLVWYKDEDSRREIEYGVSYFLAQYLTAGIPVIVPAGISNQTMIERNHLGLVVQSLDEAVMAIESMTESEYHEYARCVRKYGNILRNGYFTKKCLIDAIHVLYREDAGEISALEKIYDFEEGKFIFAVLKESYGGNLALSWSYRGKPDGFLIFDVSGKLIYETRNVYQHYFLIKKYGIESGFIVKAYIDTLRGKLCIAETLPIYLHSGQHKTYSISLIMPAYNAEDYIIRSIDTALAQSFADLEIIIVDDGSTDHTPEIIDWYAEQYPNVIAIHQENGSAPAARNTGIKYARGKYISFLDSDDMLYPDMITRMYNAISINDCDIAITSAYLIKDSGYEIFIRYAMREYTAVSLDEFFSKHYIHDGESGVVIWNKLYRASLVKEHLFPILKAEDEAWTPYILSYANRICYLDDCSYEYDRTGCNNSLSKRVINRSREEVLKSYRDTVMFYLKNGNQEKIELLKKLAKERLLVRESIYAYEEYGKLWKEIDSIF